MYWKHFWKPFYENLFSSSVAFVMMSAASQKHRPFNADFSRGNRKKSAVTRPPEYGGCSSIITLFCSQKPLTTADWCAGALSRRRNKLFVLHFSGPFLLTASLRRRRTSMSVNFFIHSSNSYKLCQRFPGTFFEATTYGMRLQLGLVTKYPHSTSYCLNHN